jgi:formiminoglutamase
LDINANHARAAAVVSMLQNTHARTVVLGGGHDIGFPHLQGVRDALSERMGREARIGCINLDAHLDVRKPAPLRTSGSPFYLAIEEKVLEPTDLIEFGIQSHCNGPALWKYVQELGVKVIPFSDLRTPGSAFRAFQGALLALESRCDAIVISLDLDCIEQASAPGVSAPQAEGFRPMDIIELLEHAGRSPKVISLGVFELNPLLDHDDMTARIAATAAWHFIEAGLVGTTA